MKNKMFVFGLCSTSDDKQSEQKMLTKTQKMKKAP